MLAPVLQPGTTCFHPSFSCFLRRDSRPSRPGPAGNCHPTVELGSRKGVSGSSAQRGERLPALPRPPTCETGAQLETGQTAPAELTAPHLHTWAVTAHTQGGFPEGQPLGYRLPGVPCGAAPRPSGARGEGATGAAGAGPQEARRGSQASTPTVMCTQGPRDGRTNTQTLTPASSPPPHISSCSLQSGLGAAARNLRKKQI